MLFRSPPHLIDNCLIYESSLDLPEVLKGCKFDPSSTSASTVTTSVTEHSFASTGGPTSSVVSKPGKKSSLTGAIAGGVGGGVVVLAIVGRPVFYFVRQ